MSIKGYLLFMLITIFITRDIIAVLERCQYAVEQGQCFAYFKRYAYMPNGKCEEFVYGGCGGNQNNFNTKQECEDACISVD